MVLVLFQDRYNYIYISVASLQVIVKNRNTTPSKQNLTDPFNSCLFLFT